MSTFWMLAGLPCSGKSYVAKQISEEYDSVVFSSDALREEMFGDINEQSNNTKLFVELHKRIKDCLKSGQNAIYDATNINYKQRMAFLHELTNIPCKKICILMATPYEECLQRNSNRGRKVPDEVVKRMYMNFNIPYWYEGWDNIEVIYSDGSEESFGWDRRWAESAREINQDNPHHTLSIGDHCIAARRYINQLKSYDGKDFNALRHAALLHDEGKVFTKSFIDSHGNPSEIAHFYQHHLVSAYDSLFYEYAANHLHVAVLIMWHMQPYFWKEEKTKEKYRKLWGEYMYQDIMLLHSADEYAH